MTELRMRVTRAQLVRYAGASGDFNQIHYSDHFARELGLDGVIAHGMLTMGVAMRAATAYAGDPARVRSCSFRFAKPVPVPDDAGGTEVVVTAEAGAETDGVTPLTITATCGETVVGRGKAEVAR